MFNAAFDTNYTSHKLIELRLNITNVTMSSRPTSTPALRACLYTQITTDTMLHNHTKKNKQNSNNTDIS